MRRPSSFILAGMFGFVLVACGSGSEGAKAPAETSASAVVQTTTVEPSTTQRALVTVAGVGDEPVAETFGVDAIVRFDAGGTSATLTDGVVRADRNRYTLEAASGQTMILTLVSVEDNAVFDLYGPDGALLAAAGTNASIVLPADGVYAIIVSGTRGNATYDLTVEIPAS